LPLYRWAPGESIELLAGYADEAIVLRMPQELRAIGQLYEDFGQISAEESWLY